jgi:hypothetical protein
MKYDGSVGLVDKIVFVDKGRASSDLNRPCAPRLTLLT